MEKVMFWEELETLKAAAVSGDCNIKPTKGQSSGNNGKLFEAMVKVELGETHGHAVTRQGKVDIHFRGYAVEVKQGSSTLDMFFGEGEDNEAVDYVVYTPEYHFGDNVERGAYVLTGEGFLAALREAKLIRDDKVGSDGIKRHAMQSFKNSNKKYGEWLDALDAYTVMTMTEFKAIEPKAEG